MGARRLFDPVFSHLKPDEHDKAKAEKDLKRDVKQQTAETRVPENAGGDTGDDRQKGAAANVCCFASEREECKKSQTKLRNTAASQKAKCKIGNQVVRVAG